MTIGIIGAGAIGQALAGRFVAAGEQVVISNSRGPRSLRGLVSSTGPGLLAATVAEAAEEEVVVLAVPWRRLRAAVAAADVSDWQERIVIDTTNPPGPPTGPPGPPTGPPGPPTGPPGSGPEGLGGRTSSEVVAGLVPGSRLVKAFNTLRPDVLGADPRTPAGRRVIFLSGNHPGANGRVARIAGRVGWAAVDLGPLAEGGRLQQVPDGPLATLHLVMES
ncbi:NADPH-dependent F420 reductase [Streptomyces siamensis]|uniref:NADPH-dependent F420 reductase n=1 Tax=Streptomyces siamensis TaxID=1274986 RepID=A0ABP9J4E0_9ACTN